METVQDQDEEVDKSTEGKDVEVDNYLDKFRGGDEDVFVDEVHSDDEVKEFEFQSGPRANEPALPASWERPACNECGEEDGPNGGGRYGFDDHEGLFYCGKCWQAWDEEEKAKIMKPAYLQMVESDAQSPKEADPGNFFDQYTGGEGTDDIDGAWDPSSKAQLAEGEMALPGSWERPVCKQCGNDEGEDGGGRYRRDVDGEHFFCGRCWKSWDAESRRKMMMGYAPMCSPDPVCPAPETLAFPIVDCPPPDAPMCEPEDWYHAQDDEQDEVGDYEDDVYGEDKPDDEQEGFAGKYRGPEEREVPEKMPRHEPQHSSRNVDTDLDSQRLEAPKQLSNQESFQSEAPWNEVKEWSPPPQFHEDAQKWKGNWDQTGKDDPKSAQWQGASGSNNWGTDAYGRKSCYYYGEGHGQGYTSDSTGKYGNSYNDSSWSGYPSGSSSSYSPGAAGGYSGKSEYGYADKESYTGKTQNKSTGRSDGGTW